MGKKPRGRTLAEFQPLQPAEKLLLEACADGLLAEIGQDRPTERTDDNAVRAEFLRFLALGGDDDAPVHELGIQLRGAWVERGLDFEGALVTVGLTCWQCNFERSIESMGSRFHGLVSLPASYLPGWRADRAQFSGGIFLRDGFKASGPVRLLGARIGGNVDCSKAEFDGKEGDALSMDGANVQGDVFLCDGFKAAGTVRLLGAQIGGNVDCSKAEFDGKEGDALSMDGANVQGGVFLCDGFKAAGTVRLLGAQIGGSLNCIKAEFDGKERDALSMDRATVGGSVSLNDGFKAAGQVRLVGAQISGSLNCIKAEFDGKEGDALSMDRAKVSGRVSLNDGFKAAGKVRLGGAQIGGDLDCSKAEFDGKEGDALSMDGAKVEGDIFLSDGFKAAGEVRLVGARIGGSLNCIKAEFDGKEGDALSMDGANVQGNVFLSDGFKAAGEVRLLGAQIGGDLGCSSAEFEGRGRRALSMDGAQVQGSVYLNNGFKAAGLVCLLGARIGGSLNCIKAELDGKEGDALSLERASVNGAFFFRHLVVPVKNVNLTAAFVSTLADDLTGWGEGVVLDGFMYERIGGGAPTDAKYREAWLDKQSDRHGGNDGQGVEFRPQPWRQLQKVLRDMGHAEDARQVAIAFEHRLRRANLIGRAPQHWNAMRRWCYLHISRGLHWLFYALIGYGYRPLRLGAWMVAVWLLCAGMYWCAALQGVMGPSNALVFQNPDYQNCRSNWYLCEALPEEYTGFSPLTYSLDVILPLVNLQQESDWAPLIPTPRSDWWSELGLHWTLKHLVRVVVWFEVLFGWVASLLLVAVVSGLTKRRED